MKKGENEAVLPAILLALLAAFAVKLFCFDFIIAEGRSMLPAIPNGDILVVNRLAYGLRPPLAASYALRWAAPKEGDIVVFWTPFGDLAVKRCAAPPADGFFFALGDNGPASFDSRSYGPVPLDNIIGKVAFKK